MFSQRDWVNYRPVLARQIPPWLLPSIQMPTPFPTIIARNPYTNGNPDTSKTTTFASLFENFRYQKSHDLIERHIQFPVFQSLSLDDQLTNFVASLILSDEQCRIRWQFAFDVLYNLRFVFKNCEVYVFGSLLTELGDDNSDVDLYVDMLGDGGATLQDSPQSLRSIQQTIKEILRNGTCPHTGMNLATKVRCRGSRIPFLRFRHAVSNVTCDLSFGRRASVQNSKLLLFYLNLDPGVPPLLIFLRYWAKFHDISGEMEIKQYALSLLAIAYLTNKGIVPSVHLLQRLEAEQRLMKGVYANPDKFGEWDCSFCENKQVICENFKTCLPQANRAIAFIDALRGFCEMFGFVDLGAVVVCPLTGDMIKREVFVNRVWNALPEPLQAKGNLTLGFDYNAPLCVQDPFVLNFNVGGIAKVDTVKKFQTACKLTYERLMNETEPIKSLLDLFIPVT